MSTKSYFHVDMDLHRKPATKIAAVLFMLGALIHLTRVLFGWNVLIAGTMVPLWLSLVIIPVGFALAFMLMHEAQT